MKAKIRKTVVAFEETHLEIGKQIKSACKARGGDCGD